jgi:hypothetical protein
LDKVILALYFTLPDGVMGFEISTPFRRNNINQLGKKFRMEETKMGASIRNQYEHIQCMT